MAEKKADETLTLTSPTEESLTARKHEGNMADKMVDETLTSTSTTEESSTARKHEGTMADKRDDETLTCKSTTEESSTARKHEDMSDEMNAMDTIVGAESATSKELASSKTEDGYESSSWIEDEDFLKSHIEISDLEELWQDSMISDEDNLTDVLEEQRIEAKQVLQVCTVLPVQPLSKLCHFNQMNDYAEKNELTEQNLPAFLNKKKWPMLPWYKTIYMPRCVYILHITIDLSPLEKILIFLQLCCNVSILYRDEIIQKVLPILKLPENFPLELLLHYVTCQEVSCSVGPAFSDGEDVIKSIQKKHFFCSEQYFLQNKCILDNTDNAIDLLKLISDETKSLSEHPEAESVRKDVESCMQLLCGHIQQQTGWTDITIKLVGSSSEGTRTYFTDEYDFILIIPNNIGSFVNTIQIYSALLKAVETIDMFNFNINKKLFLRPHEFGKHPSFVVLYMMWKGAFFKSLNITVDLVPVKETEESCYYPLLHHCYTPTEPTVRKTIPLSRGRSKYDFSVIENEVLIALPVNVRNGYTLAKAMRVGGTMEVLVQNVINIGVCLYVEDLCEVVSSYLLKTCLLYVTKDLTKHHELEKRSDIYWASQIYAQALNFIIVGSCSCFFNPQEDILVSLFPFICSSQYLIIVSDATQEAGRSDETIATQQTTVESGTIPPQSTCSMDTPYSPDSAFITDADVSDDEEEMKHFLAPLIVIGRVLQVLAAGEPDLKIVREDFLDRVINVAFRRVKNIQYPYRSKSVMGPIKWDPLKKDMQYPGDYILEAVYDEWKSKRVGINYPKRRFRDYLP